MAPRAIKILVVNLERVNLDSLRDITHFDSHRKSPLYGLQGIHYGASPPNVSIDRQRTRHL